MKLREHDRSTATLEDWLRSPTLDNLQELEFHYSHPGVEIPLPMLLQSMRRFSSTLRLALFGGCGGSRMEATPAPCFTCRFSSSSAYWMSQSLRALYTPY